MLRELIPTYYKWFLGWSLKSHVRKIKTNNSPFLSIRPVYQSHLNPRHLLPETQHIRPIH